MGRQIASRFAFATGSSPMSAKHASRCEMLTCVAPARQPAHPDRLWRAAGHGRQYGTSLASGRPPRALLDRSAVVAVDPSVPRLRDPVRAGEINEGPCRGWSGVGFRRGTCSARWLARGLLRLLLLARLRLTRPGSAAAGAPARRSRAVGLR